MTSPAWLALDVGGANLKAAHSGGPARSVPFELWKRPEELAARLADLARSLPDADGVALTMTAELCDCYPTKAAGIRAILDAARALAGGRPLVVWGIDGRFHDGAEIEARPALAAAANWLALATLAARLIPEGSGLVIDIGSTTTDLIPVRDGMVVVRGRTDTDRLRTGELVYAGVRRTPICALAHVLPFRGIPTGLAAEVFATTLDVYLTLGSIAEDAGDLATADGRGATADAARDRLARMVGADREGFSAGDAVDLAEGADAALLGRLIFASGRVAEAPGRAVVSGSGEWLARRLAGRVVAAGGPIVSLAEAWGPAASEAACAHALAVLAAEAS